MSRIYIYIILFCFLWSSNYPCIKETSQSQAFIASYTHGAEPFSGNRSRISQHFIELQHSLPWSQELSAGPYTEPDQSSPSNHIPLRSILILSTHPHLGLPSGLFPSGFPINILYAFLWAPIHATCPAHPIHFDFIILLGEEYKLWSYSPPVTSSLFGPNILLSNLLSNTLSLCFPLNATD
jgi:hypothetical protein